ncbi:hypothetical protein V1L52_12340 [Treponema sp. HNW]|uniref:hypothetical protein n=1 Tax=Treponema sp. HNW TaxID=3116654 RepID=UPI003D0F01D7
MENPDGTTTTFPHNSGQPYTYFWQGKMYQADQVVSTGKLLKGRIWADPYAFVNFKVINSNTMIFSKTKMERVHTPTPEQILAAEELPGGGI